MATKVKPTRLQISGTAQVGYVPTYVNNDTFAWAAGGGGGGGASFGRFLSLWDCTTGMPISFPEATPYNYLTGDYFIVETVSSATPPVNYRPNGSSYTGTASSVTESDEVEVGDTYVYDGATWLLQSNHGKTVTFANIAGQPTDNTNLANDLLAKQDVLTAGTNINITSNVISATDTTYSTMTSSVAGIAKLGSDTALGNPSFQSASTTSDRDYPVRVNSTGQLGVNVPRANTTYSSLPASSGGADVSLVTTGEKYTWNNKADGADINTKTFYLSSTSDTTTAQAAYDYFSAGKNPIVVLNDVVYTVTSVTTGKLTLTSNNNSFQLNTSNTRIRFNGLEFTLSSGTVTGIGTYSSDQNVLATGVNYNTAYTPQYDGSPATKKYVDDNKGIQNDTTGTTTTVTKIRAGTEAEYALITPDANTIYYVY